MFHICCTLPKVQAQFQEASQAAVAAAVERKIEFNVSLLRQNKEFLHKFKFFFMNVKIHGTSIAMLHTYTHSPL